MTKTVTAPVAVETTLSRIVDEGYGREAWHGPNMKAALDGVAPELAFYRPTPGRHSIAEIALHHAYVVRNVRAKLSGAAAEPFVLEGDDWFELPDETRLSWATVRGVVDDEQRRLDELIAGLEAGRIRSALSDEERFDLALGVTCHAAYHAGQGQLLKTLHAGD